MPVFFKCLILHLFHFPPFTLLLQWPATAFLRIRVEELLVGTEPLSPVRFLVEVALLIAFIEVADGIQPGIVGLVIVIR